MPDDIRRKERRKATRGTRGQRRYGSGIEFRGNGHTCRMTSGGKEEGTQILFWQKKNSKFFRFHRGNMGNFVR